MHVLLIPAWYPKDTTDVIGSFFREQAIALQKQGIDVGVLSIRLKSLRKFKNIFIRSSSNLQKRIDNGIPTFQMSIKNWFSGVSPLQVYIYGRIGLKAYKNYIEEYGHPDVIHVHSMLYAGIIAMYINKKFGIPYIITEHSSAFLRNLYSKAKLKLLCEISNSSKMNIAVSSTFVKVLTEKTKQKWIAIPNIVNETFFKPITKKPGATGFKFIHISNLSKNKKIDILIEAFALAFEKDSSIQLKIGGFGDEYNNLKELITFKGLSEQVTLLGALSRNQVVEEMSRSNVFVLSSEYETFGVVLIEALALGKPVIATRSGGPEDIVDKHNGILVPVNDIESLADAMRSMVENYNSYDQREIQQQCFEKYSEKAVTYELKKVYAEVLDNHHKLTNNIVL